jgi:hypothetical protein
VYFDVCEANVIDRISLVGTINDSADTEPCCVEVGLTEPGKTYYWAVDYNDQNDGGDPCLYEGPVYSFTKWGYALNPSPTDANEDIDPGQALTLTWENDGYAFDYDVSIWNEAETKSDSTADLGTESWSPTIALALGETFLWQVQECNDWMGSELCVAGPVWTFTATLCETLDNFEGYANQTALEAVWKDYTDSGGDNAAEIAGLETNTVYEGAQSMKIGYFRTSLDPVGTQPEDYTWIVPSDANLARDGGKSVWVAYIADAAAGPSDARSERLWMGFDDGANTDVILYPGESDDANGWSIFFVALSETTNSDETSIDKIMLGMTGDGTGGAVDTSVYFDLLVRCGAVCPFDYGYPDAVAGSFAPSYTKLYADIAGPFREFINAEGETEGPDCAVDGYDIGPMIDAWLSEDILGVKPSDSNLIVEYLFDVCAPLDDLYDSSGNANHGVEVNDVNTHDGIMTLDGNDWVIVPISDINLFYGDKPWSIAVDYNNMALEQGVLFSSSDVCGWGAHHIVPEYYEGEEVAVSLQIVEGGDSWGATPFYERANHSIVVTYDPDREEENAWVYIDAVQGDYPTEVVPPDPCDPGTQIIGWTVINPDNLEDAWFMDRFVGDIDNFRIYDYALDLEGIVGLLPTGEFHLSDYLDPNPNLEVDGAFPANIINFLDHAKYGDDWGKEKPFE